VYLGVDTPVNEIIRVAKKENPKLITFSISHSVSTEFSEDCLLKIREYINKKTLLVTGGKGSPCNIPGVSYLPNFKKYYEFINSFNY
ncbi:MAG: hypothetical protein P8I98_03565, partial [Nitrospinaceae bacterium]|nr:hypothetical protein [Nitrospinaceae bacterium]